MRTHFYGGWASNSSLWIKRCRNYWNRLRFSTVRVVIIITEPSRVVLWAAVFTCMFVGRYNSSPPPRRVADRMTRPSRAPTSRINNSATAVAAAAFNKLASVRILHARVGDRGVSARCRVVRPSIHPSIHPPAIPSVSIQSSAAAAAAARTSARRDSIITRPNSATDMPHDASSRAPRRQLSATTPLPLPPRRRTLLSRPSNFAYLQVFARPSTRRV